MPYSTDSLHSLGSGMLCWTGVEQIIANAFLWLSGAYTPGREASVGVVIVAVSYMSTVNSRQRKSMQTPEGRNY